MDKCETAPPPKFGASENLALISPVKSYQTCVIEVAFRPRIDSATIDAIQDLREPGSPIRLSENTKIAVNLEDNNCASFFSGQAHISGDQCPIRVCDRCHINIFRTFF